MQRRLLAVLAVSIVVTGHAHAAKPARMFPIGLPTAKWVQFKAEGFAKPVSGVIFRPNQAPCCGVPLGGVATGCIDVDASGTFGFNALFNIAYKENAFSGAKGNIFKTELMRKLPDYPPFLGLSVGDSTWVLASHRMLDGGKMETCVDPVFIDRKESITIPKVTGVKAATNIHYWGHYPVVDMEYELEKPAPISVGLRAWSPFIPGDLETSNTPCAFFDVHLRNDTWKVQRGTLVFSFPGPIAPDPAMAPGFIRKPLWDKNLQAADVSDGEHGYVVGVLNKTAARIGRALGRNGVAWAGISKGLPDPSLTEPGTSVLVDFKLKPRESTIITYVVAWYAPQWRGYKDNKYTAMYATRFKNARAVVQRMAPRRGSLLKRVLAWQQVVYSEKTLPVWLRDTLVNNLALIPEVSYWAMAKPPLGDWCYKGGFFGMLESPRGCPQIECIPCSWYGNLPVVYFFPELARSTLAGYKHYTRDDGAAPFFIGTWGLPDMATPGWDWQIALNGPCYTMLVDRLWQRSGGKTILEEYYPSVKKNTIMTMNLRPTADGVISMPSDNRGMEWFEWGEWAGMCAHTGGLRLATVKIVERMAEAMGDTQFAEQCRTWFKNGSNAMENKLWAGNYYLNFYEEETKKKSEAVMAYQLDGEWAAKFQGIPGVFQADRISTALDTIRRCNMPSSGCGAINFANKDGKPLSSDEKVAEYGSYSMFTAEAMILGMTYIYAGQRDFGLDFVRKMMEQLVCVHRHPWDLPNALFGDTGERQFGTDYYQAMMLWAMPAAVEGTDIAGLCQSGGFVARIMAAGRPAQPKKVQKGTTSATK